MAVAESNCSFNNQPVMVLFRWIVTSESPLPLPPTALAEVAEGLECAGGAIVTAGSCDVAGLDLSICLHSHLVGATVIDTQFPVIFLTKSTLMNT